MWFKTFLSYIKIFLKHVVPSYHLITWRKYWRRVTYRYEDITQYIATIFNCFILSGRLIDIESISTNIREAVRRLTEVIWFPRHTAPVLMRCSKRPAVNCIDNLTFVPNSNKTCFTLNKNTWYNMTRGLMKRLSSIQHDQVNISEITTCSRMSFTYRVNSVLWYL